MFEFAWPWVFALLPLPWLMRLVLPAAGQRLSRKASHLRPLRV